ncbi:(2Fe-2S)-binding protein [Palleronia sp.]|uniref:(2Fe-2S)-binding protein n=1 Tax=Palleronia sp. TaxID=1940284 RepID=UPI0035C7B718
MSRQRNRSSRAPQKDQGVSRRNFLAGSATASASAFGQFAAGAQEAAAQSAATGTDGLVRTTITINGTEHALSLDPRMTVLDLLREQLDLTGTKVGCNHGQCGACTVLLDGVRVNSCFVLAAAADGKSVVTVEGLADSNAELHPMQAAFIEEDGFQCGYCTPGQIVSAIGCVMEGHAGSEAEISEYMSGNLCRCGAYKGIVSAVERARDETREIGLAALTEGER